MKDFEIPMHVGIIMDGNGRWAEERGKKRSEGHKAGAKTLEQLAFYAKNRGVKVLSVFAFSTDNFKRSPDEVNYLMDLIIYYINYKMERLVKENIKIVFSGRRSNLREDVISAIDLITDRTKNNNECILNICLNYGGQEEIVDASLKLCADISDNVISKDEVTRELFYKYLYQDLPPIDLLIRTGREKRLSNFMLYQTFYSEIYFTDVYFPDFLENEFENALKYYEKCDRKFGGVKTN